MLKQVKRIEQAMTAIARDQRQRQNVPAPTHTHEGDRIWRITIEGVNLQVRYKDAGNGWCNLLNTIGDRELVDVFWPIARALPDDDDSEEA
jgi:hypothetical protein